MVDEHLRGVRLPPELQSVPGRPLEEYVRARLAQFAGAFARRINPTLNPQIVQQAAAEAIASLPAPEYGRVAVENRDLQLVFRHDCLSLGCLDPQCVLCEHNPHRRCNVNFAPKYLVNDVLKAKCDAPIRVEIIDRQTGVPLGEDIADVHLEMAILDGNAYDAKCLEAGQERDEDLEACCLHTNNKQQALLVPSGAAAHNATGKVIVQLTRGMAQLPDLHVSDSSEAMLSGRKPPFRLLVRAVASDGRKVNIRHAVSEGYVVATRRTRTAGKVEIPNVDDHVSKLEHMGKETVKKLQDIRVSAIQSGIDITVPDNRIDKVGEFRKLALLAESDGHLRQKLQQVLKLSKEKWDDARDHAMRAVVADNRMRIWYADKASMELGLLFTCRLGNVDLDRPVGLLQKKSQDGLQTTMEATLMAQQTPAQREQVRQLQPGAVASWWQPGHPGWAIYPVDSEQFMSTGALESVSVPNEQIVAPQPQMGVPNLPAGAQFPPQLPPGYAQFVQAPVGSMAPPQTSAAPGYGTRSSGASAFSPEASAQQLPPYNSRSRAPTAPRTSARQADGLARRSPVSQAPAAPDTSQAGNSGRPSPFAAQSSAKVGQAAEPLPQQMSLQSIASMFGNSSTPLTAADLQKYQSAGLNLANFPSLPSALPSGDLEMLLQQHPMVSGMGRAPSFGMGKLESMELPDAVAAVAMLHDMGPEARQTAAAQAAAAADMQRANSGLESMQSIDDALGNVEQDIMDKVANEWAEQHPQMSQPQPQR
ncbi:probable calmodulin-binding protein 60 B at N-terminal half [Coccomyxa sp. Obi]|nr:probable calmodulin-binding protein 60 B at N-terminal half [Coccomyxa sp. Obi]